MLGRVRTTILGVSIATALLLAGCGGVQKVQPSSAPVQPIKKDSANAKVALTIGAKNFTEQRVLGQLYAQALQAAGYKVSTRLNYADETAAFNALKAGQISGYPEYTGTALESLLHVDAKDVPTDQPAAYAEAKSRMAKLGIEAFAPTPFSSSNEVATTQAKHKDLEVDSLDELSSQAGHLDLYGPPECEFRQDCLVGLEDRYGLQFQNFVPSDPDNRFKVLLDGAADLSIVFSTDPQITQDKLFVFKDPDGIFLPGNATFLTKASTVATAGPDYRRTIEAVGDRLTLPVIRQLNADVDLDGMTPAAAAHKYLVTTGYVKN